MGVRAEFAVRPYGTLAAGLVLLATAVAGLVVGCARGGSSERDNAPSALAPPGPPAQPAQVGTPGPAAASESGQRHMPAAATGARQAGQHARVPEPDGPGAQYAKGMQRLLAKDAKGARMLLESACAGGHGSACYRVGLMYRTGRGVSRSDRRARSFFEQGCMAGSASSCDAMGH